MIILEILWSSLFEHGWSPIRHIPAAVTRLIGVFWGCGRRKGPVSIGIPLSDIILVCQTKIDKKIWYLVRYKKEYIGIPKIIGPINIASTNLRRFDVPDLGIEDKATERIPLSLDCTDCFRGTGALRKMRMAMSLESDRGKKTNAYEKLSWDHHDKCQLRQHPEETIRLGCEMSEGIVSLGFNFASKWCIDTFNIIIYYDYTLKTTRSLYTEDMQLNVVIWITLKEYRREDLKQIEWWERSYVI